jgi:ABC-type bacteriocin/lantibiotic exporter with double-glycine peptidase domain
MIIAITILSTLLLVALAFIAYCFIHINKINQELNSITEEQLRQNEDIRNIMIAHMTLVQALKEAAEVEQINKLYNYNNIKGEA